MSVPNCTDDVTSILIKFMEHPEKSRFDGPDAVLQSAKSVARMFYIVNPSETTFEKVEEVPTFFRNAWPYFLIFMLLENIILLIEKQPTFRLNDSLTSISHGVLQECGRLLFRGGESYMYVYIYNNFRLIELPWNSPITWYIAAIGVDFCYYWVHRSCHEIHILWAQHQVHHSSEEFNTAVGLRQSVLQGWCGFLFYLPLAIAVPPAHFVTHQQFNLLYQFWIHTKTVKTLGLLEYVFNTPRHHRVHHGANLYCLDKNYGGVLIIWDRIFGTFTEERQDEEIVYGLVVNRPSFNILHLQTFYTLYVFEKLRQMSTWSHKLAAIFYGPSWQPGKPRLGEDGDKIKVVPRDKYEVKLPSWLNVYLLIHFCVVIYGFQELTLRHVTLNPASLFLFVVYIIFSLAIIGVFFDNAAYAPYLELLRCIIFVVSLQKMDFRSIDRSLVLLAESFFLLSGIFWLLQSMQIVQLSKTVKKI